MAYNRADSNSFAEYQVGEGFDAAITGKVDGIKKVTSLAQSGSGLKGYEGYPDHYAGFEDTDDMREWSELIKHNAEVAPAGWQGEPGQGAQYEEEFREDKAFMGVEDDAFAGYEFAGENIKNIAILAKGGAASDDISEFGTLNNDGYGTLSGTPLQSFHTFFHKATVAPTETALINQLAKAVKSVPNDTPMSVKKDYYDMAMEMMKKRKATDLRYLDLQRAEIQSNLGWLINPGLPKTGGFDAMVQKAIGVVGAKLGQDEKAALKEKKALEQGQFAINMLEKAGQLSGFEGLADNLKYAKFAVLGLLLAGGIWYFLKKKKEKALALKRKQKSRRKK